MIRSSLLFTAAVLIGCAPTVRTDAPTGTVELVECREPGVSGPLRCGTFEVPENPDAPDGRRISLKIVVAPANDRAGADPVFFLAGGPGQSATATMPIALGFLDEARDQHDLVFMDIRGTGDSNPLACPDENDDLAARLEFTSDREVLTKCLAGLDADTRFYNTPRFVADLDAVRTAMGFEQINLYGGSYGTRLGLAYMAAHPDRVRSAVLDGLAPFEMKLFTTFGADGKETLDRLFADCDADPGCGETFPDLAGRFLPWLDSLAPMEGEPRRITLTDPRTGEQVPDVPLDRPAVASAVRGLLYSTEYAALLPYAIDAAIRGDYRPLVGQSLILGEGVGETMAVGLLLSTVCAEDLPRMNDADRAAMASEPFLGSSMVDMIAEACSVWPHGEVPASLFEPVTVDIPVLLLSGAEDPVTPERWATLAAASLPRATSVTLPATAHIAATGGCADRLIDDFYGDPEGEHHTNRKCLTKIERPPFFLSATGPTP